MSARALPALLREIVPQSGPPRRLGLVTLAYSVGRGLIVAAVVVYLVRAVELAPGLVAVALSVAAFAGMAASVLSGDLADRVGASQVLVGSLVCSALAMVAFGAATSAGFAVVAAVMSEIGRAGVRSSSGALIGVIVPKSERVVLRAQLRSITNLGIAVGSGAAVVPLAIDDPGVLRVAMGAGAVAWITATLVALRLPRVSPTRTSASTTDERRWNAVTDGRFLVASTLSAMLSAANDMLTVGLPLLIVSSSALPQWSYAVLLMLNTVLVVVGQVPVTRALTGPVAAGRALRRAGLAFLLGWMLWAVNDGLPVWLALVMCAAGVAAHTLGELWQSAAGFELSFALADPAALGQYQGVFGFCEGAARTAAPIGAAFAVSGGIAALAAGGGLVAALGLVAPVVLAWTVRHERMRTRLAVTDVCATPTERC